MLLQTLTAAMYLGLDRIPQPSLRRPVFLSRQPFNFLHEIEGKLEAHSLDAVRACWSSFGNGVQIEHLNLEHLQSAARTRMTPPNLPDGEPHSASQANALDGAAAEGVIAAVGEHRRAAPGFGAEAEGDEPFVVPGHAVGLIGVSRGQQADTIAFGRFHHLSRQMESQPLKMRVPMKGRGVL